MRLISITKFAALVLGLVAGLTARAQSNLVMISVTCATALKGCAIEPSRDYAAEGVTVFCTVVVDNFAGDAFIAEPRPWLEQSNLLHGRTLNRVWLDTASAFDSLSLSVCDEAGKTLNSHHYRWEPFSQLPRHVTLLEGRTTNSLYYRAPGISRTNAEISIRLEGSFLPRSWRISRPWATSNIVRVKVY